MDFHAINPGHFRVAMLLKLGHEDIHELACKAVAVLTTYRLVAGRCLLALHESKGYQRYGCASAVHYACSKLGMSAPAARECRRVARALQRLPQLTEAAELGTVEWSKLREIVRRAVPATELYWLRLAEKHSYKEIEVLVSRTPKGSVPGEADQDGDGYRSELRCAASPTLFAMIDRMRRLLSIEKEEAVTTAEVLETALTLLMTQQSFDPKALAKARESADKDLQAQRARLLPVVLEAREMAVNMGLLKAGDEDSATEIEAEEPCQSAVTAGTQYRTETAFPGELPTPEEAPSQPTTWSARNIFEHPSNPGGRHCGKAATAGDRTPETTRDDKNTDLSPKTPAHIIAETLHHSQTSWRNHRLCFNPVSRRRRLSPAQREELLRRDGWGCSTPGCPHDVWLHLHHLQEYARGGYTSPDNLICLCAGCHRNVHRGYLKILQLPDGGLLYTNSEGKPLDSQADLTLATWLDFHLGWSGKELDSHQARLWRGEWSVFA